MNEILKNQFIRLHSLNLLDDLKNCFESTCVGLKVNDIPAIGKFNINDVLTADYFFS